LGDEKLTVITKEELLRIMPYAKTRADEFVAPLNNAMAEYEIITPERMACFLAQLAHESGELRYVRELATGEAYEGRKALGNTQPGDGVKFKGRGLIQVTGRSNYAACSQALFQDERLLETPEILEEPAYACLSAGWFWSTRRLNNLADRGDFRGITKTINGGYNGMPDRLNYFERAKLVLNAYS
jgi:putative chitinase